MKTSTMKTTIQNRSRMEPLHCRPLPLLSGVVVFLVLMLAGSYSARAFTTADADTLMNAYNNAFYVGNGGNGYFKGTQSGGDPGFWQQAEEIEVVEDANDRTGGGYRDMITSLLNGFSSQKGTDWSGNGYNDDIAWACIAYLRGYQATGNTTFRNIAKSNYDMMYARAWNTSFLGGGLWWLSPNNNSKNSAVEGSAAIAAYLLYQTLNDSSYLTKAKNIFNWQKANLFNPNTGAVYDSINTSGNINYWSSTYNQGTFIGAADYLGDTASATLAANFTMYNMGEINGSGYEIMPQYGTGNNNSGFNSIGIRWIAKFMKDHGLQNTYLGWLQANANAALSIRQTSDNLSWCQWLQQTPSGTMNSWDCASSAGALQVVPAGSTPPPAPLANGRYEITAATTGNCLDCWGYGSGNGTPIQLWPYAGTSNQQWNIVNLGNGYYSIRTANGGRSLDCTGCSPNDGTVIELWDWNGGTTCQEWAINPSGNGVYYISTQGTKSDGTHDVLDGDNCSGAAGTRIGLWSWGDGGCQQQWEFIPR